MGFSISTRHLPCLRNYDQALKHYESIEPIRGSANLRPLGDRRKQHQLIHQLSNGDIAAQLYGTDCVIYHKDGSITVNFGGWQTQSTTAFISAVSPYYASTRGYVQIGNGMFKVPGNGLKIDPIGGPVNPVQEYRTLLDKKKAAETRKKLKPFLQWTDACLELGGKWFDQVWIKGDGALNAVLDRNCEEAYPLVAGVYFNSYNHVHGRRRLFESAYRLNDAFIQVPVEIGTEAKPTPW